MSDFEYLNDLLPQILLSLEETDRIDPRQVCRRWYTIIMGDIRYGPLTQLISSGKILSAGLRLLDPLPINTKVLVRSYNQAAKRAHAQFMQKIHERHPRVYTGSARDILVSMPPDASRRVGRALYTLVLNAPKTRIDLMAAIRCRHIGLIKLADPGRTPHYDYYVKLCEMGDVELIDAVVPHLIADRTLTEFQLLELIKINPRCAGMLVGQLAPSEVMGGPALRFPPDINIQIIQLWQSDVEFARLEKERDNERERKKQAEYADQLEAIRIRAAQIAHARARAEGINSICNIITRYFQTLDGHPECIAPDAISDTFDPTRDWAFSYELITRWPVHYNVISIHNINDTAHSA